MPRRRLFVQFRNQSLNSLLFKEKEEMQFQSVSLREVSDESLVSKLRAFKEGKPLEVVLIVPREDLLSQEFELSSSAENLKKNLYDRLEKSFPVTTGSR